MAGEWTGRGSVLLFGKEGTPGTLVARSNALRIYDAALLERTQSEPIPELYQGGQGDWSHHVTTGVTAGGDVTMPLCYEGMGFLIENLMGAAPTTTDTGGSSPYTHTYHRGTTVGGLSLELVRGSSATSEIFEGA